MNRSTQIREVYAELRRALGTRISEVEALEHAATLVKLFELDGEEESKFDLRVGGTPFDQWALDVVFADGGWCVLGREPWLSRDIAEEEEYEQMTQLGFRGLCEERISL
jgi:hypothetical protein